MIQAVPNEWKPSETILLVFIGRCLVDGNSETNGGFSHHFELLELLLMPIKSSENKFDGWNLVLDIGKHRLCLAKVLLLTRDQFIERTEV